MPTAMKRKHTGGTSTVQPRVGLKKQKIAKNAELAPSKSRKPARGPPAPIDAETATDSDPVVESDTTEHSGEDDGVSWPSENEGDLFEDGGEGGVIANGNGVSSLDAPKSTKALGPSGASSSREAHAKQKTVAQARKSSKANADSLARCKKIWERLRIQTQVPKEERERLVKELFSIITGRVKEFILKHDASRIIQTGIKYGDRQQRKNIAKELRGDYRTLAQSKFAKFVIGKLIVHTDKEVRDFIVPEFYGHVRALIKHPEASWILDDIYRGAATPPQKARFLREWYGAEFALENRSTHAESKEPVTADLREILGAHPEKRTPILRYLQELINQLVQKKTTGFTILHDAMLQYYQSLTPGSDEATEFVELIKGDEDGDLVKNLAFTRSGSRLVSLVLAQTNAKDRKQLLKVLKGTMRMLAYDQAGHQVLLTAFDVVDDTVLLSKTVIAELIPKEGSGQEELLKQLTNLHARKPLMYPFSKTASLLGKDDLELRSEVHAIREATSKKDPETRRKELAGALSLPLLQLTQAETRAMMQNSFSCQSIADIIVSAEGDKGKAVSAVVKEIEAMTGSTESRASLESPFVGNMLKTLVYGGRFDPEKKVHVLVEPRLAFADRLFEVMIPEIQFWVEKQSFVVAALFESEDFSQKAELRKLLKNNESWTRKLVEGKDLTSRRNAGFRLLFEHMDWELPIAE